MSRKRDGDSPEGSATAKDGPVTPEELGAMSTVVPTPAVERSPDEQRLHDDVKRALFDGGSRPRSTESEPGEVLAGRYRLIAFLGEGGMGRVYRAHDLVLDEEVAIKFLPPQLARAQSHLERFVREVRVARQVSHPNVCRVHDIATEDGKAFLSMEYIDGEDLGALLRRIGRLGRDKAIELAHELCSGLAALHERGILHRDLKPSNIMIDGRGRARITDFGLATVDSEIVAHEIRDGTPAYQAPEQSAGEAVSVRSDLYALGAIFFEMFSGERWTDVPGAPSVRPLEAESRLRAIDPAVAAVVRQCLDPVPDERPGSALEVAANLPGGDPLAAAIAAGGPLSPQAVANAKTIGGLATLPALVILLVTGALLIGFGVMRTKHTMLRSSALAPEVLVHRSREILEQSGHDLDFSADARFVRFDEKYIDGLRLSAEDTPVMETIEAAETSPVVVHYRGFAHGPDPMGSEVSPDDPPPRHAGDASVTFDIEGHLLALAVMPDEALAVSSVPPGTPDFTPLVEAAGWKLEALEPAEPCLLPGVDLDHRVAWHVIDARTPTRIEAGSLRGRTLWFQVDRGQADPWALEESERQGEDDPDGVSFRFEGIVGVVLVVSLLLVFIAGLVRMVRTLQRPEGDAVGARRIAYFVFAAELLAYVLQKQGLADLFNSAYLPWAVWAAFSTWLFYLMMEPYARQRLPRSLIGWNRLLQGRFTDPMVGRDVLLGCCGGAILAMMGPGFQVVTGRGWPGFATFTLLGARFAGAAVLGALLSGVLMAMILYLVLSLAEAVFRRRVVALGVIFTITASAAAVIAASQTWWAAVLVATFVVLLTLFVFRYGLLATAVVGAAMSVLLEFPMDLTFTRWWASIGLLPLLIVGGLAVFGYVCATAPQRRSLGVHSRSSATSR